MKSGEKIMNIDIRLKQLVKLGLIAAALAPMLVTAAKKGDDVRRGGAPGQRYYEDPVFLNNIGLVPTGAAQTYSGDCTGIESCGDYFDIAMSEGEQLLLSLCPPDGGADFDTGLGIWDASNIGAGTVASNDDTCDLQSQLTFTAPSSGTYRALIGTYSTDTGGTYTLVYQLGTTSIATAGGVNVGQSLNVAGSATVEGNTTTNDLTVNGDLTVPNAIFASDINAFGQLRMPVSGGEPTVETCATYYNEGALVYDYINNYLWVCAPEFGGWKSIVLPTM